MGTGQEGEMAVSPRPWRESGRESSWLDTSKHGSSSPERCVSPTRGWLEGGFHYLGRERRGRGYV